MNIDAYPLHWPDGWPRARQQEMSRFKVSFAKARDGLFHELERMGVRDYNIILSTNIPLRRDGLPYANHSIPEDSGAAVYFKCKDKDMVFACDRWKMVQDNIQAIRKTIEALRGIERWGASDMIEKAFTGFQALPAAKTEWFEILGCSKDATEPEVKAAYRRAANQHHPDKGGKESHMMKINEAWAQFNRGKSANRNNELG